jgi:hypothetical protein
VSRGGSLLSYPDYRRGAGGVHCWARSGSGTLAWYHSADGDTWGTPADLGGRVNGPPECLIRGARLECFAVNTAGHLAQIVNRDGSGWGAWADLGGSGLVGRPICVSGGATAVTCFVRSTDKRLWWRAYGTSWGAWKQTGAGVAKQPACVKRGTGTDCLGVDANGNLLTARLASGKFGTWKKIYAGLAEAPQCLVSSGKLDCFGRAANSTLWKGYYDGTAWKAATNLGGSVAGQVWANRTATGFSVYATTAAGHLAERDRVGATWNSWADLDGSIQQRPTCLSDSATGRVDCFAKGNDGSLQQRTFTP